MGRRSAAGRCAAQARVESLQLASKLECTVCRRLSDVTVNGSKELTNARGIGEARMIRNIERRKCSTKIGRRIALSTARCNGIPQHLADALLRSVRGFVLPTLFDAAKNF